MKKAGRPKKEGAKQSGQLSPNECRFSFICEKDMAEAVRTAAQDQKITLKKYMYNLLMKVHGKKSKAALSHEEKLKIYLKNKKKRPLSL